jgi:hypothetical protein
MKLSKEQEKNIYMAKEAKWGTSKPSGGTYGWGDGKQFKGGIHFQTEKEEKDFNKRLKADEKKRKELDKKAIPYEDITLEGIELEL